MPGKRAGPATPIGKTEMIARVLVPLDDSDASKKALSYAAWLAERLGIRVTLLRAYNFSERFAMVDAPTIETATDAGAVEGTDVRAYLETTAAPLRARGLAVDVVVVDAPAADAILDEAEREPSTLVVMSTHPRSWLKRLVSVSTTQDVLQKFTMPVLLIREDE